MFGQLKDLYNLHKQVSTVQVIGESSDKTFKITLNGNHELLKVDVSPDINLSQPEIEKNIREAYNDALEKLKQVLSEKFKGML